MSLFQLHFKTTGTKTISQKLDTFSRDTLSSKLYKLSQVKSFEKEIITFLADENKMLAGIITPMLDKTIRWAQVRTFNHEILTMDKKEKQADLTLRFDFEAISHKYCCLSILNQSNFVCVLDDKGGREIQVISVSPLLVAVYSGKAK